MTSLLERFVSAPPVFDAEKAKGCIGDLQSIPELQDILSDPRAVTLLTSVFGNSPYLSRLILRYPSWLADLMTRPPDRQVEEAFEHLLAQSLIIESEAELMTLLRQTKARLALLFALADISGVWSLFDVTSGLSRLADTSLQASLRFLLREAHRSGKLVLPDLGDPEKDCGLFILAMGKHGANELNYSSDIDVIVFYDAERLPIKDDGDPGQISVRLTKQMVKMMQDVTADGYVFRTDLRLRPDAGATAVAISVIAAELYYEGMGQNWERAAMIKSRVAAGDQMAAANFLKVLEPFVFRRYLDFAAIEDVHSIKRQIHSAGKHKKIAVAGHNLKLGLGGIREIEFFVQTQQLIAGGRNKSLRNPTTCGALEDLAHEGMITQTVAKEMRESYFFLRTIEHRLQMLEDAQTHSLPKEAEALDHIARFSGYDQTERFENDVLFHLRRVNAHYMDLFSQEEALSGAEGSLVFTGVDDDPDTLETLEGLGFKRPKDVAAAIRGWHFGRIRATRSERARERLTKLIPVMLEAIAKTPDPDTTFSRFRDFLAGQPAGVQLFSLFYANAELLYLITDALGMAPRLAAYLAQNSSVIDALLDADFLVTLPTKQDLAEELRGRLIGHRDFEDALDRARRWGKDHDFRIGLQILRGVVQSDLAGSAYAGLADAFIEGLTPVAQAEVARQHGHISNSSFAVIGMGKLGGGELTATSDLDLILVSHAADDSIESDGSKPIDSSRYFTRVAQRTISALSAPTAEGSLYEVDMKLRPAGNAGPISTKFAYFDRYYREDAWTWELMALTRARVIFATGDLGQKIESVIREVLCAPRDLAKLTKDVLEMRDRVFKEKGAEDPWDIKQARGGLIDLEFLCQFLQLAYAHDHPIILNPNTGDAIKAMQRVGVLTPEISSDLLQAHAVLQNLGHIIRIAVAGSFKPEEAGLSLGSLLATSVGLNEFNLVEPKLIETEATVLNHFRAIVGGDG